jgi:hypothetical protein
MVSSIVDALTVPQNSIEVCSFLDARRWCCQTNANQSQFFSNLTLLGRADAAPLGKSSGTVQLEV